PLDVYLVDQSREGGRFPAADRASDENQSVLITGEKFEMLRQTELVHRAHFCVDNAKDEIDPEALAHDTRAIPGEIIRIGEVGVAALVQLRFLGIRKKAIRKRERLVRGQTRRIGPDRLQSPV